MKQWEFTRSQGPLTQWIPQAGQWYPLDIAARCAGTTRSTFLMYCRWGIIRPVLVPPYGVVGFTEEAIKWVRLGERLRVEHGINAAGVRLILSLLKAIERSV